MPIRFYCEACTARIKVPDGTVGKLVKCPGCGHAQRVQEDVGNAASEPVVKADAIVPVRARKSVGAGVASNSSDNSAAVDESEQHAGVESHEAVDEMPQTREVSDVSDAKPDVDTFASMKSGEPGELVESGESSEPESIAAEEPVAEDAVDSHVDVGDETAAIEHEREPLSPVEEVSPAQGDEADSTESEFDEQGEDQLRDEDDAAALAEAVVHEEANEQNEVNEEIEDDEVASEADQPVVSPASMDEIEAAQEVGQDAWEEEAYVHEAMPAEEVEYEPEVPASVPVAAPVARHRKVAVARPASRDRRMPESKLTCLLMAGWVLRVLAVFGVAGAVKVLLMMSDAGAGAADVIFVAPILIGLVVTFWAVGELALAVRNRFRSNR